MKKVLIYDGSFSGFLTGVFKVFDENLKDVSIMRRRHCNPDMFTEIEEVDTDADKYKQINGGRDTDR